MKRFFGLAMVAAFVGGVIAVTGCVISATPAAAAGPQDFTPPALQGATASIQGVMLNESGGHFSAPGAVISIASEYVPPAGTPRPVARQTAGLREHSLAVYPDPYLVPGIRPPANGFTVKVKPRFHRVGVSVPDGYDAQVSIAVGNVEHPPGSFVTLQSGTGSFWVDPGNSFVDIHVRYVRNQAAIAPDVSQQLSCNAGGRAVIPTDPATVRTFNGSQLGVTVGLSSQYGGIASMLELTNRSNNASLHELIDDRSGAGAAWQTAMMGMKKDGSADGLGPVDIFNQGAGNFAGTWGYRGAFSGLSQTNWIPMHTDHRTVHSFEVGGNVNTSPCYNDSVRLADGQINIASQNLSTPFGSAVRLHHTYRWRPTTQQEWDAWWVDQGMYLRKDTAAAHDLRVYFIGAGGAWTDGPIRPYQPGYGASHAASPASKKCVPDSMDRCTLELRNLTAAVFVWNIGGEDFAMVAHAANPGTPFTGILGTSFNGLDCHTGEHECGNIEWHSHFPGSGFSNAKVFQKGQVYPFTFGFTFGSIDQLSSLGLLGNSDLGLPGRGAFRLTTASASEALAGWPASAAIDGNPSTSYSSHSSTRVPNRFMSLTAWYSEGVRFTSKVVLRARMLNGMPNGFPASYDVYFTTPDNTAWTRVGSYTTQPDASGTVQIVLPNPRATAGVMIVPTELGTDNYGNYYFQLAEVQASK